MSERETERERRAIVAAAGCFRYFAFYLFCPHMRAFADFAALRETQRACAKASTDKAESEGAVINPAAEGWLLNSYCVFANLAALRRGVYAKRYALNYRVVL